MKTVKRIMLLLLVSTMLVSPCIVSRAEGYNPGIESNRKPRWHKYKNWMSDTWAITKDKRYCDLVLIGTHDSGTYDLKYCDPFQIEEGLANTMNILSKIPLVWDVTKVMVNEITFNKSVTQDVNIYNQLMEGNRFLDLRFKKFNGDGKFRTFHGMFGDDIDSVIDQIRDFIRDTDSREIVYINFNQFGFMWDLSAKDKRILGQKFRDGLGDYMFTPEEFAFTKTMSELTATGKRLVVHAIDEVAEGVIPTLKNYTIPQAQHGSQLMEQQVIPNINRQYNSNYRTTKDTNKLNQWYQMKLQYSWVPSEDLDPVVDRLKKVDIDGARKLFTGNLSKTLRDFTNESRTVIYDYMLNTGSGIDENQPNIWLRDFYNMREVGIAIMRNFGKNVQERYSTTKDIYDKLNEDPYNEDLKKVFDMISDTRRMGAELEGEFATNYFKAIETIAFGGQGSKVKGYYEIIPTLLTLPQKVWIRCGDRVDQFGITYNNGWSRSGGGSGGSYKELTLASDEYIVKVTLDKGWHNGIESIHYIELVTNKGHKLSGGKRTGSSKSYTAPSGWYMFGSFGKARNEIENMRFGFRPIPQEDFPYKMIKAVGSEIGNVFDTGYGVVSDQYTLKGIKVAYDHNKHCIRGIGFIYNDETISYGNMSGADTILLPANAYFKNIYIYKGKVDNQDVIRGIGLLDSQNNIYKLGDYSGTYDKAIESSTGWSIAGFYGSATNDKITRLGVYEEKIK